MENEFINNKNIQWISSRKTTDNILCFRKMFTVKENVKAIRLFIVGLGFYQGYVNGKQLDDRYYKPSVTDYKKRNDPFLNVCDNYFAYYDVYDITGMTAGGDNELTVSVAPGYFHDVDKYDAPVYDYGKHRLRFLIQIEYEDGTDEFCSDENTDVAVSESSSRLFRGDYVNFSKTALKYAHAVTVKSDIVLKENPLKGDVVHEEYSPITVLREKNHCIFDFSRNHTGGISCLIKGKKGQTVRIRYSEFKNEDGTLNYMSSAFADFKKEEFTPPFTECKSPKYPVIQENTYVLSGKSDKIEPLFSWRTYRYVEVISDGDFKISELKSLFIYADVDQISSFECSNELINHIYDCYIQTEKCNMHAGLLTDCPHREKSAYTGDGQVTVDTVLRNFDAVPLLSKWLDDIIAAQNKSGRVPNTVPDFAGGGGNFWGYAIVKIPLALYNYTGNKEYLRKSYSAMYRWIIYLLKSRDERGVVSSHGNRWFLGDWLAPKSVSSDAEYVNTVCLIMAMDDYFRIGKILGEKTDDRLYCQYQKTKEAVNAVYFKENTHSYSKNIQGETMLALYADIVPSQYLEKVMRTFFDSYCNDKAHIDTGFILTPYLFEALTNYNELEAAYKLLTKEDFPSFAYMLKNETTIPEHWSKKWVPYKMSDDSEETIIESTGDVSHCHPMYGAIVSWIEENIGGLNLKNIAENSVTFAPKFIDKVSSCSCSYRGIKVSYGYENGFESEIEIPDGFACLVGVPLLNGKEFTVTDVKSGTASKKVMPFTLKGGRYRIG